MALATLLFRITGNSSGFRAATGDAVRSTERLDKTIGSVQTRTLALAAAAQQVAQAFQEAQERAAELDRRALELSGRSSLLGEDRGLALALSGFDALGVGAEQAFDAQEAITDALRNRPEAARPAARAIGLDVQEFLSADPNERLFQLIDALGQAPQDAVLGAASELGAGDIRDFAQISRLIARRPELHPRHVSGLVEPHMLTSEQSDESAVRAYEDALVLSLGQEMLAGGYGLDRLLIDALSPLPGISEENMIRNVGRSALGDNQWVPGGRPLRTVGEGGFVVHLQLDENVKRNGIKAVVSDGMLNDDLNVPYNTSWRDGTARR